MVKTVAILAFIGAAATGAVVLSQTKTVIDGKVMAADLLEQLKGKGITEMRCDDKIPIGAAGAVFQCEISASDHSTAKIEYTMDRKGSIAAKLLDSTGPTQQEPAPADSDPWTN